jgi:hypothetical protein
MTANKVSPHWASPPGYFPPSIAARVLSGRRIGSGIPLEVTLDDQRERGNVFFGTPDQVYEQIREFWEYSGGFGNMLMMGQAGFLGEKDTLRSMKLYAEEVMPRLKALEASTTPAEAWEKSRTIPQRDFATQDSVSADFVR